MASPAERSVHIASIRFQVQAPNGRTYQNRRVVTGTFSFFVHSTGTDLERERLKLSRQICVLTIVQHPRIGEERERGRGYRHFALGVWMNAWSMRVSTLARQGDPVELEVTPSVAQAFALSKSRNSASPKGSKPRGWE